MEKQGLGVPLSGRKGLIFAQSTALRRSQPLLAFKIRVVCTSGGTGNQGRVCALACRYAGFAPFQADTRIPRFNRQRLCSRNRRFDGTWNRSGRIRHRFRTGTGDPSARGGGDPMADTGTRRKCKTVRSKHLRRDGRLGGRSGEKPDSARIIRPRSHAGFRRIG